MNYGLYLAASGLLVNMHRQDVVANNLANVHTVGFKPQFASFRQRDPERIESGLALEDPNLLLEKLGGGVFLNPTTTRFDQGNLTRTGQELDLAVRGEGFFRFSADREDGSATVRLSRDGRLALDTEGYLIHSGTSSRLLDSNERPIRLDSMGKVTISPSGEVMQDDSVVATIQLVTVDDLQSLKKIGANMFRLEGGGGDQLRPASGSIQQRWIEDSAVDPMVSLMAMQKATGAVTRSARLIQYHDEMMDTVINRFARVG